MNDAFQIVCLLTLGLASASLGFYTAVLNSKRRKFRRQLVSELSHVEEISKLVHLIKKSDGNLIIETDEDSLESLRLVLHSQVDRLCAENSEARTLTDKADAYKAYWKQLDSHDYRSEKALLSLVGDSLMLQQGQQLVHSGK